MGAQLVKILTRAALISAIISMLYILGQGINALIPWSWLIYFFVIFRNLTSLIGFIIDLPTLYVLISLTLTIQIIFWTYKATIFVINWFR